MKDSYEIGASSPPLPRSFLQKRLQSLTGFFLVLFLFEHLLTNSQAALFIGDDGLGFVQSVNWIKSLPYLPVIELTLLGVPFLVHGLLGMQSLLTAQPNSMKTDGRAPALPSFPRNQAYTWQRITALILVVGLFLHVTYMRFIHYPEVTKRDNLTEYRVTVTPDPGLQAVCLRLGCTLESKGAEEMAVTDNFGTAVLLSVRDAFKSVWICVLYSFFVSAACFHAMNGIWTFAITWGISLTERSRIITRHISNAVMALILFLGFAAIWGTYWVNLTN
ncbi:MAG: sdhC [Chlamydiia bacterium]|nr:sdhC [Chlamydiia bacterium]